MKINIGYTAGRKAAVVDTEKAMNPHILCIGASGSGKTVEAQHIISDIVRQGGTVLAVSMHGSLAANQIFGDCAEDFERYGNHIYADRTGIPCPLFTPLTYPDGSVETEIDMTGAIADIICRSLKLRRTERTLLRKAVERVAQEGTYHCDGFRAIGDVLRSMGKSKGAELYEQLRPLFSRNIFTHGESFLKEGYMNIIHLDRLDLWVQNAVVEILLSYVWRLGNASQFEERGIYLFLDECQNVNTRPDGALASMLSEGRKMGIRLILATQMILRGSTSSVQERLTQCGTILIFKPAADGITQTAKIIDPAGSRQWYERLRILKVGEFVACGTFVIAGMTIDYPVVVSNRMYDKELVGGRTAAKCTEMTFVKWGNQDDILLRGSHIMNQRKDGGDSFEGQKYLPQVL